MLFLLFIILLITSLFSIYHFYNLCYLQKQQLMLLSTQNDSIKRSLKNIEVKYRPIKYCYGSTALPCKMHLSPLTISPVLCNLDKNLDIQILDCAQVMDIIWYEIRFSSDTNINSKGWILATDIGIFKNTLY